MRLPIDQTESLNPAPRDLDPILSQLDQYLAVVLQIVERIARENPKGPIN